MIKWTRDIGRPYTTSEKQELITQYGPMFWDGEGRTALATAILLCDIDLVRFIVQLPGVDVNQPLKGVWTTPLHLLAKRSADYRACEMAKILVQAQADPAICDSYGETIIFKLCRNMAESYSLGHHLVLSFLLDHFGSHLLFDSYSWLPTTPIRFCEGLAPGTTDHALIVRHCHLYQTGCLVRLQLHLPVKDLAQLVCGFVIHSPFFKM